jgi:hypothetical protein
MGSPSRLGPLIAAAPGLSAVARFAAHLTTEFPAVFAFLWDARLDATNWRARISEPAMSLDGILIYV